MTELKLPTKPPPPPPKFKAGMKVHAVQPSAFPTRKLERYELPMHSEYVPLWKHVLQVCGYPRDVVVLDFETYFDGEYKMAGKGDGLSTIEYVTDKRFETTGLGILRVPSPENFPDYENQTNFWVTEDQVFEAIRWLQDTYGADLSKCTVVAQNARFDGTILVRRFGICPPYFIDLLALARHWNSRANNDLDSIAKRFGLPAKGNTDEFMGLTFRTRFYRPKGRGPKLPLQRPKPTDDQIRAFSAYGRNDIMREWEAFTLLLPRMSNPKTELRIQRHTLDLFFKPSLKVDYAKGDELIEAMEGEIDRVVSQTGATREEISGDNAFEQRLLRALDEAGDPAQKYYKIGKSGYILAIAKDDPERKLLEEHPSETVRNLMAARAATSSWPLHIGRINRIMNQAKAADDYLPVPLNYHGAHTGRWSGGEKINLQNLGSRGHELVNAVREMLIAPPGKKLVIIDSSQVEARGTAWIAGQEDLLADFRDQDSHPERPIDVYTKFASRVLGRTIRKPKKEGAPGYIAAVEHQHKWGRNAIGKIGVLGCGYGMGTQRIFEYAQGAVDMDMADRIKVTYREANPRIVQFWYDVERAFLYTAKYQKPCEMPRGLKFHSLPDCDVVLTLPNGRELHYHKVRVKTEERGEILEVWNHLEHHWDHIWGGHLTENIVQAFCRDILAEAFLRLEDRGLHTAHHIHDEIVAITDEGNAPAALKMAVEELRRPVVWAPGLPLNAEGVIAERYGGH